MINDSGTSPHCNPQKTQNEFSCCADIIMREGWKIKSDYPYSL